MHRNGRPAFLAPCHIRVFRGSQPIRDRSEWALRSGHKVSGRNSEFRPQFQRVFPQVTSRPAVLGSGGLSRREMGRETAGRSSRHACPTRGVLLDETETHEYDARRETPLHGIYVCTLKSGRAPLRLVLPRAESDVTRAAQNHNAHPSREK